MFVYKHTETIDYVEKVAYVLRKIQTSRVNDLRILRFKNTKFLGNCFYIKPSTY